MRNRHGKASTAVSPFLIDHRHQLPWYQRYTSHVATALLWGIWILLWRPVMIILGLIGIQSPSVVHHIIDLFVSAIERGMLMIAFASIILLVWNKFVPTKSFRPQQTHTLLDYAQHFGLDAEHIEQARLQQIITVYHDQNGHITNISN